MADEPEPGNADLAITITPSGVQKFDQQVTLSVRLTNGGPQSASNIQVETVLPEGLEDLKFTPPTGTTYDKATGIWTVPTLSATSGSNSLTLTIVGVVDVSNTTLEATAEVIDVDQNDPDSTPGNLDQKDEDDSDTATLAIPAAADLELDVSVDNPYAEYGETVTFTVTLDNKGPDTATGVIVTDTLPTQLTDIMTTTSGGTVFDRLTGKWQVPSLSPGDEPVTLKITGKIDVKNERVTNTAEITASGVFDPDSAPNNRLADEDDQDSSGVGIVERDGQDVFFYGTDGDDTFEVWIEENKAGDEYHVSLNGKTWTFLEGRVSYISFEGGSGDDTATVRGSSQVETATLNPRSMFLNGPQLDVEVTESETILVYGMGGDDIAYLNGSTGDDLFRARPEYVVMEGENFFNRAKFFRYVRADGKGGDDDVARMYDSCGGDVFTATPTYAVLSGEGYENQASGFDRVYATVQKFGWDKAYLYDSSGDDTFEGIGRIGKLYGQGFYNWAKNFDKVYAYGTAGGNDTAKLHGTSWGDRFEGGPTWAKMDGIGYFNSTKGFETVKAYGGGGYDVAELYDSASPDLLEAEDDWAQLSSQSVDYLLRVSGFDKVKATAGSSEDTTDVTEPLDFELELLGPWQDAP